MFIELLNSYEYVKGHLYINFTNCLKLLDKYIIIRKLILNGISGIYLKERGVNKIKIN